MLLAGVLALLLFPVAARLAADAQPIAPPTGAVLPPLPARGAGGAVRDLPAFVTLPEARVDALVARGPAAERAEIAALAGSVFGPRAARRLARTVAHGSAPFVVGGAVLTLPAPAVARRGEANDLAALLIVAGAQNMESGASQPGFGDGGPVALQILEGLSGCTPDLNRAFLVSADSAGADPSRVAADYARAARACPGDPTPLWALAEYQSALGAGPTSSHANSVAALGTSTALVRRFPRSPTAWLGAGDVVMRAGYEIQDTQPFSARYRFEQALAMYRRAGRLAPSGAASTGAARALAALNENGAAIAAQTRGLAAAPAAADLQARLLDYLQRAHRFAHAAAVATRFAAVHRFPIGPALYAEPPAAVPRNEGAAPEEDAGLPLSTGAGTFESAQVTLTNESVAAGGAIEEDLSFLPTFLPMSGVAGKVRWCPAYSRLIDLVLSGRPRAALRADTGAASDLRPGFDDCSAGTGELSVDPQDLAAVAELQIGDIPRALRYARADPTGPMSLSDIENLRQNLWRYAGAYGQAALAAQEWAQAQPASQDALNAEGEIAFLRRRYDEAAADFSLLASRYGWTGFADDRAEALLKEGTAQAYARHRDEALATLQEADQAALAANGGATGRNFDGSAAVYAAYAGEEAGNLALQAGRGQEAAGDYAVAADAAARQGGDLPLIPGGTGLRTDVLENNRAIADMAAGAPAPAVTLAAQAIAHDPGDAIYWWTAGQAQQQLGHDAAAIADDRAALARDPSEFPVANNLGVLLVRRGRLGAGVAALRRAVGADPWYAIGWFNLGVALDREGPGHLVTAQGATARAAALDPSLVSRASRLIVDDAVHDAHLDLSKPLPPHWTFARSQRRAPAAAAGLSALLLLAIGLARSLSGRAPGAAKQWLPLLARLSRYVPRHGRLQAPAVALAATAACLLWPLRAGPTQTWSDVAAFVVGIAILCALVLRVRQIAAARAGLHLTQETWLPGVWLGLVLTAAGLGWAPLPVVRAHARAVAVHWAGPVAVAALAIMLLVLAVWLDVPLTRSLGAAALVMAASLLTPVKPLDGATVSASPAGALPAVAVLGTSVLLVLGLL